MKTTTEGFLMNTLRRISRHMVKAAAAGAVLVAAALPIAVATEAGAAPVPVASYLALTQVGTVPANPGGVGLTPIFGQSWSGVGTFVLSATDAANLNGSGAALITTTAPGVTFSGGTESVATATQVVANIAASATTPAGYYPATITDGHGTLTIANAFFVNAAPIVTGFSPATVAEGNTAIPVTITGTGFQAGMTLVLGAGAVGGPLAHSAVTVTSPTTGTLTVTTTAITVSAQLYAATVSNPDGGTSTAAVGITVTGPTITSISPASLPTSATATTTAVTITGTGFETGAVVSLSGSSATVGAITYTSSTSMIAQITVPSGAAVAQLDVTVTNPDLSHATAIKGLGIGEASSAAATVTAVTPNLTLGVGSIASLTITGTGFGAGQGATVQFLSTAGTSDTAIACGTTNVVSDTSIICTLSAVGLAVISGPHSVEVKASAASAESNALANALTITGPVITSVSPAAIGESFVGTLTVTGTGFSGTPSATVTGTGATAETGITTTLVNATTITITDTGSNILAVNGPALIMLTDGTQHAAFSVPVVIAPTVTGVVYPGTTTGVGQGATKHNVTITGSGFLPAATLTFSSASGITALATSVSPTAIVASVTVPGTTTVAAYPFTLANTNGGSATGSLNVTAAPGPLTLSPSAIKAGATATMVTISGAGITATSGAVVTTNSTIITLGTVTPAAGSLTVPVTIEPVTGTVPIVVAVTVTNADGGTSTTLPATNLIINPGITITGTYFVPTFSKNLEVVIHGTGFEAGMTLTSSNAAYTVAIANIAADGTTVTLLVSTTSAATSGTSTSVVFTNPDGNTVTFLLNGGPALAAANLHASRCVGHAIAGKTVTMNIVGTGFYGQPKISGPAGTRVGVTHDTGKMLTIRVTVARGSKNGIHTFTIRLANGKTTSVRYNQHA